MTLWELENQDRLFRCTIHWEKISECLLEPRPQVKLKLKWLRFLSTSRLRHLSSNLEQLRPSPNRYTYVTKSLKVPEPVIIHVHTIAGAPWGFFLVYNVSEDWGVPERGRHGCMFYSCQPVTGGRLDLFCFFWTSGMWVKLLFWCICLWFCVSPADLFFFFFFCTDTYMCQYEFVWLTDEKFTLRYVTADDELQHYCWVWQWGLSLWLSQSKVYFDQLPG